MRGGLSIGDDMSNEELIKEIRSGKTEYIETLWEQIYGFVRKRAIAYDQPEIVDDITQEAFISMLDAIEHYDPDGGASFLHYFARFYIPRAFSRAHFGAVGEKAKKDPQNTACSIYAPIGDDGDAYLLDLIVDPDADGYVNSLEDTDFWQYMGRLIEKAIETLPEEERQLTEYMYRHDSSLKDAIEKLGLSDRSYSFYKDVYRRGLKKIKQKLIARAREEKDFALDDYLDYHTSLRSWKSKGFTSRVEIVAMRHLDQQLTGRAIGRYIRQ